MDDYDAIRALTALVEKADRGDLYDDYDVACTLVGDGQKALIYLTSKLLGNG